MCGAAGVIGNAEQGLKSGCHMKILDHYSHSRDNNFKLLRLIAAYAVVVSHARAHVFGDSAWELLQVETGYSLGNLAVNVFFIISGFLITQSFLRSTDVIEYITARVLRLVPGLLVAAFITAFIIGPLVTSATLGAYFGGLNTWIYVPLVSSLVAENSIELKGVFDTLVYQHEVNIPLWTLRWEFLSYLAIAVLGLSGILVSGWRFALVFALFVSTSIAITLYTDLRITHDAIDHALRLGYCYLLGAAFFTFRKFIPLSLLPGVFLWAITFAFRESGAYQMLLITALGYSALWLAFIPAGFIRNYNRFGDISYGVYIYGFLLGQVIMLYFPLLSPSELLAASAPVIFAAATLSYYLIEAPAMRERERATRYLWNLFGVERMPDTKKLRQGV